MTTNAITPLNSFKIILQREDVQERFSALLDKRAPAFTASLLSLVSQNDKLLACNPTTILTSAAKAAALNLPVEPALGFAHIVPFKSDATFIIGYKGLLQLALRTNQYAAINADAIYQGEDVTVNRLTGEIAINGHRTGDEVIGYFAYFKMKNGYEKYVYMTVEQVHAHGAKYSKSYTYNTSAWQTNFDAMAKKTVLRQLLSRWGLLSIEMMDDEAVNLPTVSDDPRLRTPDDVLMPSFDDIIEGETLPSVTVDMAQAVMDAGLTDNAFSARGSLKKAIVDIGTPEKAVAWARLYYGWRDGGVESDEAAAKANAGEVPQG
jgi:recombination protein RecT